MIKINRARRFWIGIGLLLLVLITGFAVANQMIPYWGIRDAEKGKTLPGDDIFNNPVLHWEHGITIHARPEQVWPWLVQMGDTRAGYYSYRFIEKGITAAAGIDASSYYPNTNRIVPEWQNPPIGQGMILDVLVLRQYKPNQYLVAGPNPQMGEAGLAWTWAVFPEGENDTRLIVHMKIQFPGDSPSPLVSAALNLSTFMMEKKNMEGIKLRAEGGSEGDWEQYVEALVWFAVLGIGAVAARNYLRQSQWMPPLLIGLISVVLLFLFTYIQPPILIRLVLAALLAASLGWNSIATFIKVNIGTKAKCC